MATLGLPGQKKLPWKPMLLVAAVLAAAVAITFMATTMLSGGSDSSAIPESAQSTALSADQAGGSAQSSPGGQGENAAVVPDEENGPNNVSMKPIEKRSVWLVEEITTEQARDGVISLAQARKIQQTIEDGIKDGSLLPPPRLTFDMEDPQPTATFYELQQTHNVWPYVYNLHMESARMAFGRNDLSSPILVRVDTLNKRQQWQVCLRKAAGWKRNDKSLRQPPAPTISSIRLELRAPPFLFQDGAMVRVNVILDEKTTISSAMMLTWNYASGYLVVHDWGAHCE